MARKVSFTMIALMSLALTSGADKSAKGFSQKPKSGKAVESKKKESSPSQDEIKKWIEQLGDKTFKVRTIAGSRRDNVAWWRRVQY